MRGPAERSFGLLDHARCYPIPFLNGPDHYDARLLSLERPTPRARTYADRFSENVCEVTLVAEAALRATSDSDSPSSLSLSWMVQRAAQLATCAAPLPACDGRRVTRPRRLMLET